MLHLVILQYFATLKVLVHILENCCYRSKTERNSKWLRTESESIALKRTGKK